MSTHYARAFAYYGYVRAIVFLMASVGVLAGCIPPPETKDNAGTGESAVSRLAAKKTAPMDVVKVLKKAGLEAETPTDMEPKDFGPAPYVSAEAMRFLIPSLGKDAGGRIFTFTDNERRDRLKRHYDMLGEQSAWAFSWTIARDRLLVQINGELPKTKADKYKSALESAFP